MMEGDKNPKQKKNKPIPGGLLLTNGMKTTNATRLPSIVNRSREISLTPGNSLQTNSPFAHLLKNHEVKPKIKPSASKADKEGFLAEEKRRIKQQAAKDSAKQSVIDKRDKASKNREDDRKKTKARKSNLKQDDIVTFGVGQTKRSDGNYSVPRINIKREVDDDENIGGNVQRSKASSRRITDSDDESSSVDVQTYLQRLKGESGIGVGKEVFTGCGPVRPPLVMWVKKRKSKNRRKVSAKKHVTFVRRSGGGDKRRSLLDNTSSSAGVTRADVSSQHLTCNPSWVEAVKLGKLSTVDSPATYVSALSSGLFYSNPEKGRAKAVHMKPNCSVSSLLLKKLLRHDGHSTRAVIKVPPNIIPTVETCDAGQKRLAGKLEICKSGRTYLNVGSIKLEMAYGADVGSHKDLVFIDMKKLQTLERVNYSREEVVGEAFSFGSVEANFQLVPSFAWLHNTKLPAS